MKIAVLLSGRINDNETIYKSIMDNIIGDNYVDFFICHPNDYNKEILENVKKLYNPKDTIKNDEKYFDISKYPYHFSTNKHNTMCMYLNKFKLFEIFNNYITANNINYDIVFLCRMDIFFHEKINLPELKKIIDDNILCIPKPDVLNFGIDHFAFGNYETIKLYSKTYESLKQLLDNGVLLHPETLLENYFATLNIKIVLLSIKYHIIIYK